MTAVEAVVVVGHNFNSFNSSKAQGSAAAVG